MSEQPAEERSLGRGASRDDDLPLVERSLAGDTPAFEELVRRHERRVYRTTLAITGNPEDAEEAMQDTFLKAYQHLGEFQRASRFTTWLTRIAVNESLQRLRRRRNTESLDEPLMSEEDIMPRQVEDWHANPEQLYAAQEIRQFVEEAICSLPPAYRLVFVLRDVADLSTLEAAAALGLTIPALKSRLLRARLMMREALAAHFQRRPGLKSRVMRAGMMIREAFAAGSRPSPEQKSKR